MEPEKATVDSEGCMPINSRTDVVDVRQQIRELCEEMGFSLSETTRVVTATSEMARNIIEFAGTGEIFWEKLDKEEKGEASRSGLKLVFKDNGPGIDDLEWAMRDGTSTGDGLGKGMPGAEKLMDEMQVDTEKGAGTRITVKKWLGSYRD